MLFRDRDTRLGSSLGLGLSSEKGEKGGGSMGFYIHTSTATTQKSSADANGFHQALAVPAPARLLPVPWSRSAGRSTAPYCVAGR